MLWSKLTSAVLVGTLSVGASRIDFQGAGQHVLGELDSAQFICDLPPVLDPSKDGLPSSTDLFSSKEALLKQVERHGAIVKIPTISYDDNGEPGEDPRWDVFYELHAKLEELYPFVHARMTKETVNTFGLVYTIKGQDPSLKPIFLTAHQDVVPVADPSTWKYPPFSAHFDGRWLWGRGASDDKNSLTGIFSALETLLANSFWSPRRTIIVALGFDEESGVRGAGTIGVYLEELYGPYAFALLLDEGGMGLELLEGNTLYALPAVMEKGHLDIWFDLKINGGHSSTPFPHTGIGIMSEIVVKLESNPYEPELIKGSPIHNHFSCQAKYSPDAAPKITKLINDGDLETLAAELATIDRATHYRLQTSQAVDYFMGGVKMNAMPEKIRVGVNYRIAPQNSVSEIKARILDLIKPIVKKYGLTINAFQGEGQNHEEKFMEFDPAYEVEYNGTLTLTSSQGSDPTRISPTSGAVWDVFSGTIQHTFAFPGGQVVPVGELMTGNTDTRYYTNLTKNIYRWTPTRKGGNQNTHTVDEAIDIHAHLEAVKFYYDLVRNFDASDA